MFMKTGSRSALAYKNVAVETSVGQASAHDLVTMLFDGLLLALRSARAALARGDIKSKCENIVASVRILEEGLVCGLNREDGGQLAANLGDLYAYCVVRLTQANARNDDAALAEVIRLIEPVASGWKQIGPGQSPQQLMAA